MVSHLCLPFFGDTGILGPYSKHAESPRCGSGFVFEVKEYPARMFDPCPFSLSCFSLRKCCNRVSMRLSLWGQQSSVLLVRLVCRVPPPPHRVPAARSAGAASKLPVTACKKTCLETPLATCSSGCFPRQAGAVCLQNLSC